MDKFAGQGYCVKVMDSQFESGRHIAPKRSKVVVSENPALLVGMKLIMRCTLGSSLVQNPMKLIR